MFISDNDCEVIEYKTDERGIPTHVATLTPDTEPFILMEGLAAQFRIAGLDVGIRVTGTPYLDSYRGGYYDSEGSDERLSEAWSKFEHEFGGDDAREAFARYVDVYRPGVAMYSVNLNTGCSQGDWVNLILWMDEKTINDRWTNHGNNSKPINVRRAEALGQAYQCLKAYCDEFEKAATGEAYIGAVYELDASIDFDTKDGIGTEHTIQFELGSPVDDCGGMIGREYAEAEVRSMLESV